MPGVAWRVFGARAGGGRRRPREGRWGRAHSWQCRSLDRPTAEKGQRTGRTPHHSCSRAKASTAPPSPAQAHDVRGVGDTGSVPRRPGCAGVAAVARATGASQSRWYSELET